MKENRKRKYYLKHREEIIEKNKEYRKNHPQINKKAVRTYYYKNWNNRNCILCGRFCPKGNRKYCSFCKEIIDYLQDLSRAYANSIRRKSR